MTGSEITHILASLATLTFLEIILGIDNIVFIAILSGKLPKAKQKRAQQLGLTFAWVTRLLLLSFAIYLTKLTSTLFTIWDWECSARDLFLLIGGSFLILNATNEIHEEMSHIKHESHYKQHKSLFKTIVQIGLLDIVFSLDSILTAVGLTQEFWIMATAITIAIITMIFAAQPLSQFIEDNPSVKMLALSFLILIGTVLMADSFDVEIPRGYIYAAVTYSLFVESLNILRQRRKAT